MIRFKGTVVYKNGRPPEPFEGGAPVLAKWEMYALRHGYPLEPEKVPKMLWMHVLAHAALGVPEGFDVWLDEVDDIDDFEASGVPPTLPAASSE
jgi:hypothetical protein